MIHKSHFGVYAVIINNDHSKILLIKKARGPYTGLYDLPGGSMEDGELLDETLIREVKEETNCTVTTYRQIGAYSTAFEYKLDDGTDVHFRHIGVLYDVTIDGTPNINGDRQDSHGCIWMTMNDIDEKTITPLAKVFLFSRQKNN